MLHPTQTELLQRSKWPAAACCVPSDATLTTHRDPARGTLATCSLPYPSGAAHIPCTARQRPHFAGKGFQKAHLGQLQLAVLVQGPQQGCMAHEEHQNTSCHALQQSPRKAGNRRCWPRHKSRQQLRPAHASFHLSSTSQEWSAGLGSSVPAMGACAAQIEYTYIEYNNMYIE